MKNSEWIKRKLKRGAVCLTACLFLSGCGAQLWQETDQRQETASEKTADVIKKEIGVYDSSDTAVVVKKSETDESITFFNIPTGKNYTLSYDGTTVITDKYGGSMSMEQLQPGDILDITFVKSGKKLVTAAVSQQVWTNQAEGNYKINQNGRGLLVANDQYKLADNVMVLSEGMQAGLMDINECDGLLLKGIDRTIYSITIEKGHGYLRLENSEYFTGGWIEVGQSVIQPVTEDMLLVVPEGEYDVLVTNRGHGGSKPVSIARNEEVSLDVGDLKGEETLSGSILFTTTPSNASVYIDGKKIDASQAVTLEYGVHQMIVKAEGYTTMAKYIRVGQPSANLNVEMEPVRAGDEDDTPSVSGSNPPEQVPTVSGGDVQTVNASGDYKVSITAPEETEVYFDGKYIGLIPVSFKKEEGMHVVTLRKTGCQTRSFTIQIDKEPKDISWSFSKLEAMK